MKKTLKEIREELDKQSYEELNRKRTLVIDQIYNEKTMLLEHIERYDEHNAYFYKVLKDAFPNAVGNDCVEIIEFILDEGTNDEYSKSVEDIINLHDTTWGTSSLEKLLTLDLTKLPTKNLETIFNTSYNFGGTNDYTYRVFQHSCELEYTRRKEVIEIIANLKGG